MIVLAQSVDTYTIKVGQFNRLKVVDDVNVVYRQNPDSTGMARFSGAKEFADAFILTPKDGQLKVQVSTEDIGKPYLPTLYVYSDFLTHVENSSNFTVSIENLAPCAEFNATLVGNGVIFVEDLKSNVVKANINTGNGSINISGKCRDALFRMVGTGIIQADRMEAETVKCSIFGGGTIGCWAKDKLNVKGIGSTKIYYKGDPEVKKSGGGKVIPLPEDGVIY